MTEQDQKLDDYDLVFNAIGKNIDFVERVAARKALWRLMKTCVFCPSTEIVEGSCMCSDCFTFGSPRLNPDHPRHERLQMIKDEAERFIADNPNTFKELD